MGIVILLFVTLPSIIYSITWGLLLFIANLLTIFKARTAAISITDKLNPLLLIAGLPIVFYVCVSHWLAIAFGGWMILYFILRRWSGVSKVNAMQSAAFKQMELLRRESKRKAMHLPDK